ncbi:nitronate monooxygenase family protein [Asticcacaulis sp. YBE204]|uniref:NAD(P)H-dependent flavin oxidoreductase n=1 Tax=Asticcacaulis sp. YBE204 TaxID=1282363 RepID=UPI0003C3ABF8|nr:nitronate monooxygenase family protein [Asticcacaulis sp. YBE204]ESQ79831.1 2-nitropropane dioxygenase [Asticcacaulis sp. YBE204]
MAIPDSLKTGLTFPAIAAPMFLVSGPELVIETCKAGMIGTFPALNQRTTEGYAQWLDQIQEALTPDDVRFGVNLIVHPTNSRLMADMVVTVDKKVPLVITSLGAVRDVVDAVHSYGGVVFHDIVNVRHAEKAAEAGVDGLILVCNGAGGHAGTLNPFALLGEVRKIFSGTIILSGCLSTGSDVAAALMMGADLGYMGTRFIATKEAMASDGYKTMLTQSSAKDIVYTPAISGVPASFLLPSLEQNGLTKDMLKDMTTKIDMDHELNAEAKAWKTIWSAGQGTGSVRDVLPTAELVTRLKAEFAQAQTAFTQRFA